MAVAHILRIKLDTPACAAATCRVVIVGMAAGGSAAEDRLQVVNRLVAGEGIGLEEDTNQEDTFQVGREDTDQAGTSLEGTGQEASSRVVNRGSQVAYLLFFIYSD